MTDILFLCRRARASTRCGASIDAALRHVRAAALSASEAGSHPKTVDALARAERELLSALNGTEVHRQRLLRKADRKEHSND